MNLTEAELAPYRDGNDLAHLLPLPGLLWADNAMLPTYAQRAVLPDKLLTPTHKVFSSDWHTPKDIGTPQKTLQAIPVLAFRQFVPILNPALQWQGLIHQCAGLYCYQMRMIATRLRPQPAIAPHLNAIVREYYDADVGFLHQVNLRASHIVSYAAALGRLGLTCETSWSNLNEGAYPIDATQENLDLLAEDAPPLSEIADWSGRQPQDCAIILLLAENSD